MKILHVNKLYYPWIGGVEKVAQDIAEGLEKENSKNVVLVCQPKGERRVEEIKGIKLFRAKGQGLFLSMPISLDFFFLFKKLVKEHDMVFLHHPFPLGFLAYVLFGRGKNLVVWYHSDIVRQKISGALIKPLIISVLHKSKKIFVSSNNLILNSKILRKFKNKCSVIPFGIDLKFFGESLASRDEIEEIKRKYGKPLVLSVGRLVYYKGYEYLIDSADNVEANFLIIGNGPLKKDLENLIEKKGLERKVKIIDPVEDLLPYYLASDVFVLPSSELSEAFGVVQIEAMTCGKPVINTSLPTGVPEVSIDGETGLTVSPKNSKAISKALKMILNDKRLKDRMGKKAKERAEKFFSKDIFIEKISRGLLSSSDS